MQGLINFWLVFQKIGVYQQTHFVQDKQWRNHDNDVSRAYSSTFLDGILSSCFIEIELMIWKKKCEEGSIFLTNTRSNNQIRGRKHPSRLSWIWALFLTLITFLSRSSLFSCTWGCMFYPYEDSTSTNLFLSCVSGQWLNLHSV